VHPKTIGIKDKPAAEKRYQDMNNFEKETYNLISKLKLEIKPESLQNTLIGYIKQERDQQKLTEFVVELQLMLEARRSTEKVMAQRMRD